MGYTTQPSKLMIGLGVSAIGDTWTGFAQNVKVVEEYLKRVDEGQFPIFRGHMQSDADLRIRALILDIMCHFIGNMNTLEMERLTNVSMQLAELQKGRTPNMGRRQTCCYKKRKTLCSKHLYGIR